MERVVERRVLVELEPVQKNMQEHGDRKKENSNGRSDEDKADQRSRRENLRLLQRGPLVDVYS